MSSNSSNPIGNTNDPTVNKSAKTTDKVKGDIAGAVSGTIGSAQAATGATIRNKAMEEKGFEKMDAEDARLAAKKGGDAPVGSDKRH